MLRTFVLLLLLAGVTLAQDNATPPEETPATRPAASSQDNAAQARKVIDSAIQALGGAPYLAIKDVSAEGRTYSFHLGRSNSAGLIFYSFYRYPDKERIELTKKRDVIYVFNGGKGWEITYKGAKPQPEKDVADYNRRHHYALDVILREWINKPGVALFYEGSTVTEQKPVDQVTIMNAANEAVTLYFDSSTHLPVKKSYSWRDPTDKERNIEAEIYDNYRPVQGVMTPFDITRTYNGDMANQRFLNSVKYNDNLPDATFSPEAAAEPKK
ncbi:MAG: hypothetical protein H0X25_09625 [Acidobacteriales bacterium]|nr:hypothetical protein [Terriglobales bacterium]